MEDNILNHIEDDKDTIVISEITDTAREAETDAAGKTDEAGEKGVIGETAEPKTIAGPRLADIPGDSNKVSIPAKRASRGLFGSCWIVAVLAGSVTGIWSAVIAAVLHFTDAAIYNQEQIDEMSPWMSMVTFGDEHAQAEFFSHNLPIVIGAGILAVAAVIVLSIMTGRFRRNDDGSIKLNWFDRIWSEIHLAVMCLAAIGAVVTTLPVYEVLRYTNKLGPINLAWLYKPMMRDDYAFGIRNSLLFWLCTLAVAACLAITVVCWLSLVKKGKAHGLIRHSLIFRLWRFLGYGASAAGKEIAKAGGSVLDKTRGAARKASVLSDADRHAALKIKAKYIAIFWLLIILPYFLLGFTGSWEFAAFCVFLSMAVAALIIILKVGKLAEIRAGVIEVKSGNLTHKITVDVDEHGPKTDLDKLASDINHISEATNIAVQNEIKNQRLKTDLISNVSHDLKTPLTSMISYLDILEKEGLDSPDAPAHLAIVREKTERLRTLTEELFEAAKASSGNIPCEIETIDLAALIDQTLAEMGDRLSSKNLEIKKKYTTDNTLVRADGKLLCRVLENLLGNISKYALEGSRVYIDVSKPSDARKLLMEIKNISKAELNISPDELMERFTRGDQSRNTEGSGLGLAIAKDLTTLMGGVFEIKIDGDMFKVSILLNEA